jgi:glycosyltransferase involved in cell wall biosynthesis
MPTRNRRQFVAQSIWYFLRQDYAERELLILDDGEDAVGDLVPPDERIRYVRLDERLSLGAKRNLACELSRGNIIAHWDDDDWIAPQRLSVQVSELLAANADVCGARDLLHYDLEAGQSWLYRYPAGERNWLSGNTLLYHRAVWAGSPFPHLDVGEDSAFILQLPADRLHAVPDSSFYIALIHPQNTGAKNLRDPRWEQRPLDEVSRLLAFDREFYVSLRNGKANGKTAHGGASASTITVAAPVTVSTGYGSMAEYMVCAMARAGASINLIPVCLNPAGMSEEFLEIFHNSKPDPNAPVLYYHWVSADLERFKHNRELFIHTMWESSQLPRGWSEQLNCARAVSVPTRFVARVFRESGVRVPIEVIPDGVAPEIYHYEQRPTRDGLTTLMVCPVEPRKNTLVGVAAWKQAFADDPRARLIIKTNYSYGNYTPDDPRITYVDSNETTRGIAHWYRQADVLLALGNEGFGLPLVEAMATGLPVIALNSEGQGDICEDARELVLQVKPVGWRRDNRALFGPAGVMGVPGADDVAAHLRWVDTHRTEAREMGRASSAWALKHRNVWDRGLQAIALMESQLEPTRPLRRTQTFWVPSLNKPCGVAEYTSHLLEQMPQARASAQFPDLRGVKLLHIQHEFGLFNNAGLTAYTQQARQARVPIAITEHMVAPQAQAWESIADTLLTLTERGAETLRARCPGKQVEVMPVGCPTWFPARKRSRGRVIGAFGFLARYKGFWRLPDVLREVEGTELLLLSHAKHEELERQWEESAAGLPVRRIGHYLPVEEVARRLAAEADILVFWYDEIEPYAAASYAVRIGLATGVPVLTSPTSWFEDLRAVTYQPADLVEGVRHLLDDTSLQKELVSAARSYCEANSWSRNAERHQALWRRMENI